MNDTPLSGVGRMLMQENPKDVAAKAERRTRLDLLDPRFKKSVADALAFGAIDKGYGVRNYTKAPIEVRTYIAAIYRHLDAYLDGEDYAPDSGVSHLGHAGAGLDILFAAEEAGTLIDDRKAAEVGQTLKLPEPSDSWKSCQLCSPRMACGLHREEATRYYDLVRQGAT